MAESLDRQLKRIMTKIENNILDYLDESVAESVIDIAEEKTKEEVYDAYEPVSYNRTGRFGKSWTKKKKKSSKTIEIWNDAKTDTKSTGKIARPKYIAEVIETGVGYTYKKRSWQPVDEGWKIPRPKNGSRPVVQKTKKELSFQRQTLINEYKKYLRRKGIRTK